MAKIEITIDDALKADLTESVCKTYRYQDKIQQLGGQLIDNPVSKDEFAKNIFISFAKEIMISAKANEAAESARKQAIEDANKTIDMSLLSIQ